MANPVKRGLNIKDSLLALKHLFLSRGQSPVSNTTQDLRDGISLHSPHDINHSPQKMQVTDRPEMLLERSNSSVMVILVYSATNVEVRTANSIAESEFLGATPDTIFQSPCCSCCKSLYSLRIPLKITSCCRSSSVVHHQPNLFALQLHLPSLAAWSVLWMMCIDLFTRAA